MFIYFIVTLLRSCVECRTRIGTDTLFLHFMRRYMHINIYNFVMLNAITHPFSPDNEVSCKSNFSFQLAHGLVFSVLRFISISKLKLVSVVFETVKISTAATTITTDANATRIHLPTDWFTCISKSEQKHENMLVCGNQCWMFLSKNNNNQNRQAIWCFDFFEEIPFHWKFYFCLHLSCNHQIVSNRHK